MVSSWCLSGTFSFKAIRSNSTSAAFSSAASSLTIASCKSFGWTKGCNQSTVQHHLSFHTIHSWKSNYWILARDLKLRPPPPPFQVNFIQLVSLPFVLLLHLFCKRTFGDTEHSFYRPDVHSVTQPTASKHLTEWSSKTDLNDLKLIQTIDYGYSCDFDHMQPTKPDIYEAI